MSKRYIGKCNCCGHNRTTYGCYDNHCNKPDRPIEDDEFYGLDGEPDEALIETTRYLYVVEKQYSLKEKAYRELCAEHEKAKAVIRQLYVEIEHTIDLTQGVPDPKGALVRLEVLGDILHNIVEEPGTLISAYLERNFKS